MFDANVDRRLNRLTAVDESIRRAAALTCDLEDRALAALYDDAPEDAAALAAALAGHDFTALLLALFGLRHPDPDDVTLGLVGGPMPTLARLAVAYLDAAEKIGVTAKLSWYEPKIAGARRFEPEKPRAFLSHPDTRAVALAVRFSGPGVVARFAAEAGVHEFVEEEGGSESCLVEVAESADYDPFPGRIRAPVAVRRTYKLDQQVVEERHPRREFRWSGRKMHDALAESIEERLFETLRGMLLPCT